MRGNIVMHGYFADADATARAFPGGWFHSGDLAVWHPDGSIAIQDRSKDIIISGGEVRPREPRTLYVVRPSVRPSICLTKPIHPGTAERVQSGDRTRSEPPRGAYTIDSGVHNI